MVKNIIWATVFIIIAGILQSTLISKLLLLFHINVLPDLTLCILVFSAYLNGAMTGQITGFVSGLFLDFLSQAPLGMNAFIRTLAGAFAGALRGSLVLDAIIVPAALCAAATLFKVIALFLLNLLFAGTIPAYSWTSPALWIELLLNAVTAPFLFDFLKSFSALLLKEKKA